MESEAEYGGNWKNTREEHFHFCNQLSKEKMENMIRNTNNLYQHILIQLYPDQDARNKADDVVCKTMERIIKKEEIQIQEATEKKLYDDAYELDDPYFLANFRAIFPIVKAIFFDKNIRASMVKFNFNPTHLNIRMKELVGGDMDAFFREFRDEGEKFYQKMMVKGFHKRKWSGQQMKGITGGIIREIYSAMKIAMKRRGARERIGL